MLKAPECVPELGFYYHYKHDPAKGVRDYAYEVIGIGSHTETDAWLLNYRPLYVSAAVYQMSLKLGIPITDERPLEMFFDENVEKDGKVYPRRFTKITDLAVIEVLTKARNEMYPF